MWAELKYRWGLRKFLRDYALTRETHASVTDFGRAEGEPDIKRAMEKEQMLQEHEIGVFLTNYLVKQAYLNAVPVPEDEDSWLYSRFLRQRFLTQEAAGALRDKIRSVQKQEWDYLASRITLVLATIGCIFGVLAYFKR